MTNIETVQSLYAAFGAKDMGRVRTLLAPDVEWNQMVGFPGGGTRVGVEQVIEGVFGRFKKEWTTWRVEIGEYLDAGEEVVVLGVYAGEHKQTGRSMRAAFAHLYTVRGGRITRFRQYTDTKVIADAAGA